MNLRATPQEHQLFILLLYSHHSTKRILTNFANMMANLRTMYYFIPLSININESYKKNTLHGTKNLTNGTPFFWNGWIINASEDIPI